MWFHCSFFLDDKTCPHYTYAIIHKKKDSYRKYIINAQTELLILYLSVLLLRGLWCFTCLGAWFTKYCDASFVLMPFSRRCLNKLRLAIITFRQTQFSTKGPYLSCIQYVRKNWTTTNSKQCMLRNCYTLLIWPQNGKLRQNSFTTYKIELQNS